ncbi:MAG: translation initiation factor 6, partial [Thermoproteota archaeon]
GIMSPMIPTEFVKKVEHTLGIEIIQSRVARYHQAGAMVVATSHGGIVHPNTEENDIKIMSEVLGVNLEAATINGGIPYVASGILANNKSLVVGTMTNGPELVMLTRAFKIED